MLIMRFPENRKLFTINQAGRACGVSRATLLRLEESGFLKPYMTDPDTGYRYYDAQNVASVGQYQWLQASGLSRSEIADLYYERVDAGEFLRTQREKLSRMQRFLDEYELRHDHSRNFSFSYVTLPEVTCRCTEFSCAAEDIGTLCFMAHEDCIEEGYRLLGSEPMFAIPDDQHQRIDFSSPLSRQFIVCIPVTPDPDGEPDPKLRHFPAAEAFSLLGFGDFSIIPGLSDMLWKEFDARGLEASGPARFRGLIAPYSGAHFGPDDFCYEYVVPVKERK